MTGTAFSVFAAAALLNTLNTFAQVDLSTDPYTVTDTLGDTLNQLQSNDSLYTYPTDLTRNLVPKALHSHNDYWRDIPFYSGLSVGAISTEADVWLYNGTLFVGHEKSALTTSRTFDALYVQPILRELNRMNPSSPFVDSPTKNGLFDTLSTQTLYLWVDCKTDGHDTFKAVISELEPLRSAGYLTNVTNGKDVQMGPVTVIGTGNTPLDLVQPVQNRDYFWDGPLQNLSTSFQNITSAVTPIASVDFETQFGDLPRNGTFTAAQYQKLLDQVNYAKGKGIGARYWDTPEFPISTRNKIWQQLWEAGVMLINVDDLEAGAGYAEYGNYW